MNFVGIDFSINSPGICIHDENSFDYFINIQRNKIAKKHLEVYRNSNLIFLEIDVLSNDLTYHDVEILKVKEAEILSRLIIEEIKKIVDPKNTLIGIEGFSYNGIGLRSLDLAGFQYILRTNLMSNFENEFSVFSPNEIKKFAIKGNASKEQMIQAYKDLNVSNELTTLLNNDVIKSSNKFPKPIDDLVDAFFITRLLKENFLKNK